MTMTGLLTVNIDAHIKHAWEQAGFSSKVTTTKVRHTFSTMAHNHRGLSNDEQRIVVRGMDHSVCIAREGYASTEVDEATRFRHLIDAMMKVNRYQSTLEEIQIDAEEDVMLDGGYIDLFEGEEHVPSVAATPEGQLPEAPASGKRKGKGRGKSSGAAAAWMSRSKNFGRVDVWSPLWISFLKMIVTENYINICANPQWSQKVVIDVVRPMWNRTVANFQEMSEEEKRKVPDVEEYAKMLYSIQIHQVMNKVRHLVALKR